MPENKVAFGLKNAHYAIVTEAADGTPTYATPVRIPGSVELTLEPKGETTDFYADDILYFTTSSNQGYETTLTLASIPLTFKTDVLGEILDATDKVLTEDADLKPKKIAFLFEFDGDLKATRHVLYNCTVTRPGFGGATKTETAEPRTNELTMIAAPRPKDRVVKRSTTVDTTTAIYDGWFTAVYNPTTP